MKRAGKVVLLAHCILNVNAKVDGLATVPAGCTALVSRLLDEGYGIIQLPCMEQLCCGISRWGQVKEQLDFPAFRRRCAQLLEPIVDQTEDFIRNGYRVCGVIGLDGSPSCGVNETCSGRWGGEIGDGYGLEEKIPTLHPVSGSGVMMEVLRMQLAERGLSLPFLAVNETDPDRDADRILFQLKESFETKKGEKENL